MFHGPPSVIVLARAPGAAAALVTYLSTHGMKVTFVRGIPELRAEDGADACVVLTDGFLTSDVVDHAHRWWRESAGPLVIVCGDIPRLTAALGSPPAGRQLSVLATRVFAWTIYDILAEAGRRTSRESDGNA